MSHSTTQRQARTNTILALLLVLALVIASVVAVISITQRADASTPPIFTVMNTSETLPDGVWFRNSPHTADTNRITGLGVYRNEQVQLFCYSWGDAVGPYTNRLWYFVTNVTRPTNKGVPNEGYLNAHYINDGKAANQIDAGVPDCSQAKGGGGPSPSPSATPTPAGPHSVFYSPNDTAPDGIAGLTVADLNLYFSEWAAGNCSPSLAADIPDGVNTLAGWSLGRLGPIYFLDAAGTTKVSTVHTIILFDPGNSADFASGCDTRFNINALLANWLRANKSNRLLVFTGERSEEIHYIYRPIHSPGDLTSGRAKTALPILTFAGLWRYYFADIWNKPFASQATVCDYYNMGHPDVLQNFAWTVNNTPGGCPNAPSGQRPVTWHP